MMKRRVMCMCSVAVFIAFISYSGFTYAGSLEPGAPPGPTMKTLDEIPPTWSQRLPAAQRFEVVFAGAAVLDKETGLVWEKSPTTSRLSWVQAMGHCITKVLARRKGWRAPTIEELASLIDQHFATPKLTQGWDTYFSNIDYDGTNDGYWSSTSYVGYTSAAWQVRFRDGSISIVDKDLPTMNSHVWCVRGGFGHDAGHN